MTTNSPKTLRPRHRYWITGLILCGALVVSPFFRFEPKKSAPLVDANPTSWECGNTCMSVGEGIAHVPFEQSASILGTYGGVPIMAGSIYLATTQVFSRKWDMHFTPKPIVTARPEGVLGTFGVSPLVSGSIHLLAEHNFSVRQVFPQVAAPGENVTITMTGWLGIPAGNVSVYLFPLNGPMAKEGHEPVYYKAERDHRITAGRSYLDTPAFSYTTTIVAGNEESKCNGGDMCDGRHSSDEPPYGDYRVAVGFPSPYYTNGTILVMGPVLRIQTTGVGVP